MKREIVLGNWFGLKISARLSAAVTAIGLALFAVVIFWSFAPLASGLLGGLAVVILHWFSELFHHLGHAWAARRSGFPMQGVRFWGPLAVSLYPRDEPELPAQVHIQRALGGPLASLLLSILAAGAAWWASRYGGVLWWVALVFFLDNFLVLTLGAFLPLGFTDGSTLLTWMKKR